MVYENIITGVEEEKLLPYEKCLEYGASSLDNAELLAAIIRTGTNGLSSIQLAEKLLENAGNLNGLYGMSVSELIRLSRYAAFLNFQEELQSRRLEKDLTFRMLKLLQNIIWKI